MLLAQTESANSVVAGLAIGVDLHSDVLLAAGYPFHLDFSLQRIMKRNQLVRGRRLHSSVGRHTDNPKILTTVSAVHGGILLVASLALDLVRILHRAGEGSRKRVDEHTGCQFLHPIVGGLAHLASELVWGIEFILLEAFEAEGVQAAKGLWVLDSLMAEGTLDQLGNYR